MGLPDSSLPPSPLEPFPSMAALRAANLELAERRRQSGESPELFEAIASFMTRASASGVLLDDDEERWSAQGLLDYWATVLDRAGLPAPEPALVDFDLSAAPHLPASACPYLGLDAFTEADADYFFGRHLFVGELLTHLETNRLLAVVGPSGSGKSSVVRAGLIPALQRDELPGSGTWAYLGTIVPGSNPLAALRNAIEHAQPETPLVLFVDQFEELFTLCPDPAERQSFIGQLCTLVQGESPQHRVIMTMRSDFEGQALASELLEPLWTSSRIYLPPLSAGELREAIEQPAAQVGLRFEPRLVDELLRDVVGEPAALPLLQFTLLKLWDARDHNYVSLETFREIGGGRLALSRSADALYDGLITENQVTMRRILLRMVRPGEGLEVTSNRVRREDLFVGGEDVKRVEHVLGLLAAARLVRQTDNHGSDAQVEVAHEALIRNWPKLIGWIEDERTALRQRRRLTDAAEQWQRLNRDPATLLRGTLLAQASAAEDLTELERAFVVASQEAAAEQDRALILQQQRDLEQAQLLVVANARATRNRTIAAAALGVALLASLVLVMFLYQNSQALIGETESLTRANATAKAATLAEVAQRSTAEAATLAEVAQRSTAEAATLAEVAQRSTAEAARSDAEQAADEARAAEREARAQRLAFAARIQGEGSETGLLMAYESVAQSKSPPIVQVLRDLLEQAIGRSELIVTPDSGTPIAAALDAASGRVLVGAAGTGLVSAFDQAGAQSASRLLEVPELRRLVISPRGSYIGTVSGEGERAIAQIWSRDGRLIRTLQPPSVPTSLDFDPNDEDLVVVGTRRPGATVMRVSSGSDLFESQNSVSHDRVVHGVAFGPRFSIEIQQIVTTQVLSPTEAVDGSVPLPDASAVVTATENTTITQQLQYIATASEDNSVRVWDAATGQLVHDLRGHTGTVWDVAFSPDGRRLASVSSDQVAYIWDMLSGERLVALRGHTGAIYGVQFSADGSRLVTASIDRTARVWDTSTGQTVVVLAGHSAAVNDALFGLVEGQIVTVSNDGSVRYWRIDTARPLAPMRRHSDWVRAAVYSPDGAWILSGADDGNTFIWDSATGEVIRELDIGRVDVTSVSVSPGSDYVVTASASSAGYLARIWDPAKGQLLATLNGHSEYLNDVAFSPDGRSIATGGADGVLQLWDLQDALQQGTIRRLSEASETFPDPINEVAFSPASDKVLVALDDGTAVIWDIARGESERVLGDPGVPLLSAAFDSTGTRVVTGSEDQTVRVWGVDDGQLQVELRGHSGSVWHVEFGNQDQWILSSSSDQTARIWEVASGETVVVLRGHSGSVLSASFHPNWGRVVTGSVDTTVRQHMLLSEDLLREAACRVGRELDDAEVSALTVDGRRSFTLAERTCPPQLSWQQGP